MHCENLCIRINVFNNNNNNNNNNNDNNKNDNNNNNNYYYYYGKYPQKTLRKIPSLNL